LSLAGRIGVAEPPAPLVYPVFFPACIRAAASSGGKGGLASDNATRDRGMMGRIEPLMNRYE
jgi:hypothetical protein